MLLQQQFGSSGIYKRIHVIWKEKGMFDAKEQLLDQKWQIDTRKWFSHLQLNEIKETLMGVTEESDESGSEGSVG